MHDSLPPTACPPIVLLAFNRPDLTSRVFDIIRKAAPSKLYVVADGPRDHVKEDVNACREVRELVQHVDWDCQSTFDFAEANLGCAKRVSTGITNAMETLGEAIILEDDCLPDPSFFGFCARALTMYRDDPSVVCVTGDNFQDGKVRGDGSFYFSKYPHCWGWATWKRAWNTFDLSMEAWPTWRDSGDFAKSMHQDETGFWASIFDRCFRKEIDSWAFPWTLACWMQNGKTVTPNVNLVTNIGSDSRATHTSDQDTALPRGKAERFRPPSNPAIDQQADLYVFENHFGRHLKRGESPKVRKAWTWAKAVLKETPGIGPALTRWRARPPELLTATDRQALLSMPRFTKGFTELDGKKTCYVDAASFLSAYDAIFRQRIYAFHPSTTSPLILDCGANVGLSTLFFATIVPNGRIIAFEPDKEIFSVLQENVTSWGLKNVELRNTAVWSHEDTLHFEQEGADGGRICEQAGQTNTIEVTAEPLSAFLNGPIEFLKIDIEGAETTVIQSVERQLHCVNKLFVEYHSFPRHRQSLHQLLQVIDANNFRFSIHSEHAFPTPFIAPPKSDGMDLGLNIFCWRERWIQTECSDHD